MRWPYWRVMFDRIRARVRRPRPQTEQPPRQLRRNEPPQPSYLHGRVKDSLAWRHHVGPPRRRSSD